MHLLLPRRESNYDIQKDKQQRQIDAENSTVRRRLQEAALSEAMSAPGRCKRQLLAMSLARATTTQPSSRVERPSSSGYRGGGAAHNRSASLPPQPRSSSFGPASYGKPVLPPYIPVRSLSEFLSSKEEKASSSAGRRAAKEEGEIKPCDDHSGISSVTTGELSVEDDCVKVNHNPKQERKVDKSLLDSPNSTAPNDDGAKVQRGQPRPAMPSFNDACSSNNASTVMGISTPNDYRSDLLYPMATVDMDEGLSEHRQSPERSQSSSPKGLSEHRQSPEHSKSSSPASQQLSSCPASEQQLLEPADSPVDAPSNLLRRTTAASPDISLAGMCHLPRLLYNSRCITMGANDVLETKDAKAHNRSILKPKKSSASSSSPKKNNCTNDAASPEVEGCACNDIKAEEGEKIHECKNSETSTSAETVSSDEDAELLASNEGSNHNDSFRLVTGDEGNTNEIIGAIHGVPKESENDQLYTDPNPERPSTPRTAILEQQGWSHHHRFARHRSIPTEQITIVPLNHVSAAVVVNTGGGGGMNGRHNHGMVDSCSAKDLVELRALMDELPEYREWKAHAAKSLENAHTGSKEVEELRISWLEASEEVTRLRAEGEKLHLNMELLKCHLESEVLEWKTAAEKAVTESSKEIATLSMNDMEMRAENERLSVVVDTLTNKLESMLHLADRQRALAEEEARGLHVLLQADITRLEGKLEESKRSNDAKDKTLIDLREQLTLKENQQSLQVEKTLRVRDEEVSSLKSELANMAMRTSTLQATIDAANLARDVMTNELTVHKLVDARLKEEIDAHTSCKERLEATTCENQMLQEQLDAQESAVQELKAIMKMDEHEVEHELEQLKATNGQLEYEVMQAQNLIRKVEASMKQKEEEGVLLKASVKDLSLKGKELSMILIDLCDWKSNAEETLAEKTKLIDQLVSKLSCQAAESSNIETNLQSNIHTLQSVVKADSDERNKLNEELAAAKEKNFAQTIEISDFQLRLVAIEEASQPLENVLRDKSEEVTWLKTEIMNISKDASKAQAQLEDKVQTLSRELSEIKALKFKADQDLETAATTTKALQEAVSSSWASHDETAPQLESTICVCKDDMNLQAAELSLLKDKLENKTQQLLMLQQAMVNEKNNQAEVECKISEREKQMEIYMEQAESLQEELASLKGRLAFEQESKSKDLAEAALAEQKLLSEINSLTMMAETGRIEREDVSRQLKDNLESHAQQVLMLQQITVNERDEAMVKSANIQAELERKISEREKQAGMSKEQVESLHEELAVLKGRLALEQESNSKDLAEAALTVQKMQLEISSLTMMVETGRVESEKISAEMTDLRGQLQAAKDSHETEAAKAKYGSIQIEFERAINQKRMEMFAAQAEEEATDLKDQLLREQALSKKHMDMHDAKAILLEEIKVMWAASKEELIDIKELLLCEKEINMQHLEMSKEQTTLLEEMQVKCSVSDEELIHLKDQLLREQESKHEDAESFARILMTKEDYTQDLDIQLKAITEEMSSLQGKLEHNSIEHDREINAAKDDIALKSAEVAILSASVKRLEDELQETVESFNKKLMKERGPRLDESRQTSATLCAKEKEIVQLRYHLKASVTQARKIQDAFDCANLMFESKTTEIAELKENIKANNQELEEMNIKISTLERQNKEKQELILDKETEISFLSGECEQLNQLMEDLETENDEMTETMTNMEQKYAAIYREKLSHLEQESLAIVKERELLKMDSTSKLKVISDLISTHNELLEKMNDVSLSREELERNMETIKEEKMTSEILAQRIIELESDLEHLGDKYQVAKRSLAGMEEALMVSCLLFNNYEMISRILIEHYFILALYANSGG